MSKFCSKNIINLYKTKIFTFKLSPRNELSATLYAIALDIFLIPGIQILHSELRQSVLNTDT